MSKRLGGIIGCKDKTSPMVVTSGQQYHVVGEKPTVILYTYIINRYAGTPNKTNKKDTMSLDYSSIYYTGLELGGCR